MTTVALHTARPTPLPALLNPAHLWGTLWRHRDLIRQFSLRYFHARYRGTHLGMVWAIIMPLLLLGVYTFVFNFVFSARFGGTEDESRSQYAVMLFCGIIVFSIFSETVCRSSGLVVDNANYVKKIVFPIEILPVATLLSTLMFSAIGLVLVVAGAWVTHGSVPLTAVLIPVVLLPAACMGLGLAWFLASLGVFIRDVGNIAVIAVSQFLFFLTPIFYRVENLPEGLRFVARLNPLTPVVEGARGVLITGSTPDWPALAAVLVIGLGVMQLGYAWFMKSKRGFADVL
jgi:lipopolysaccharide transport system permease protein